MQDVLESARKLTAGLGVNVDLVASPLPRMEVVNDRVVPAGRRHRLPAAPSTPFAAGTAATTGPPRTPPVVGTGAAAATVDEVIFEQDAWVNLWSQ